MGKWNSDYKPIGRHRVKHVEWDVWWLHSSKWDLLESRGKDRNNLKLYWKEEDVLEVQVYGKRMYIDLEALASFIINNK